MEATDHTRAAAVLGQCPHCHGAVRPGAPWCTQCWADLRPAPPPRPAPEPVAAQAAPPAPAAAPAAPGRGWPCSACGETNTVERDTCAACGTGFLAGLKAASAPLLVVPGLGDLAKYSRGQRLALAGAAVVLTCLLVLVLGLLLG